MSRWECHKRHLPEIITPMIYSLVHYPNVDTTRINQLRKKYDPQVSLIEPHITIVFPVPESAGEQPLVSHIEGVLHGWKPFSIRLKGLLQSRDNCLFLLLAEGSPDIVRLHAELYTELLAPCLREDIPFIPHVTLGAFGENAVLCERALSETEGLKLDYVSDLDRLCLVKVNDDRSQIVWSKQFLLPR
jgi:2'-5' RNA ligase